MILIVQINKISKWFINMDSVECVANSNVKQHDWIRSFGWLSTNILYLKKNKISNKRCVILIMLIINKFVWPGATIISCFLDLILRNVKSFCGSISRTTLLAFEVSWCSRPAYCTVVELSSVVLIGIPLGKN